VSARTPAILWKPKQSVRNGGANKIVFPFVSGCTNFYCERDGKCVERSKHGCIICGKKSQNSIL